jgi:hypothetical protein
MELTERGAQGGGSIQKALVESASGDKLMPPYKPQLIKGSDAPLILPQQNYNPDLIGTSPTEHFVEILLKEYLPLLAAGSIISFTSHDFNEYILINSQKFLSAEDSDCEPGHKRAYKSNLSEALKYLVTTEDEEKNVLFKKKRNSKWYYIKQGKSKQEDEQIRHEVGLRKTAERSGKVDPYYKRGYPDRWTDGSTGRTINSAENPIDLGQGSGKVRRIPQPPNKPNRPNPPKFRGDDLV